MSMLENLTKLVALPDESDSLSRADFSLKINCKIRTEAEKKSFFFL